MTLDSCSCGNRDPYEDENDAQVAGEWVKIEPCIQFGVVQ